MSENNTDEKTKKMVTLRGMLLLVQILLPFGLYAAMRWESGTGMVVFSGAFLLSMGVLVWLG